MSWSNSLHRVAPHAGAQIEMKRGGTTMQNKDFVPVDDFESMLRQEKQMAYEGAEPDYKDDNETDRALAIFALNRISCAIQALEVVNVDGRQCYRRGALRVVLCELRSAADEATAPGWWAPNRHWAMWMRLIINRVIAKVCKDDTEDYLRSRNMWPLAVAVSEYKAGAREVDMPPRYAICHVQDKRPDSFFAGVGNGAVLRATHRKAAQMFVSGQDVLQTIELLERISGENGAWQVVDMYNKLSAYDKFLRVAFGIDKTEDDEE